MNQRIKNVFNLAVVLMLSTPARAADLTIENLGTVFLANAQERQAYFKLGNETHLLLNYIANYGVNPMQILDVNLSQGTARLTNTVLGRPGVRSPVLYPNGKIYESTGEADGKGYFFEYDPLTGVVRQIDSVTGSNGGQYSEIGDDGWIYIGGFPKAYVDRYHPPTDTFERVGSMDIQAGYAYTLGADTRYLYVGVGQVPWALTIYDTQTKNTAHFWNDESDYYGSVRRGTSGKWYYERGVSLPTHHTVWYQLTNGAAVLLPSRPTDLYVENAERGNVVDLVANGYLVGYEVDLDDALPNSLNNNNATIRWRKVGEVAWQSVTMSNFQLEPSGISRLYPWDSTHLLGFTGFYGPTFLWDVNSQQATLLGYPQFNLYDASIGPKEAYFSGYTAALLRYDRTRPWTLTGSSVKTDSSVNPYQTPLAIGKHELYSTFGSDGLVYVGAHHERNSSGGEIGWYDPSNGTKGSLRTPFLEYDISDLKPALNGTKLVYASTKDEMFIFDVATKSIERTIVPVPGITMNSLNQINRVKVVEVAPGIVFGASAYTIFKFDITNGTILYSKTLPDKAFYEGGLPFHHRLVRGPDGYIWMFRWVRDSTFTNKSALYRINPVDGSYEVIVANTYYTYGEKNLMFNGNDMYWYGGTNLYRIKDIISQVGGPNQAPVVNAGTAQSIVLSALATLQGTISDDGLPYGVTSSTWSKVSGPGTVVFANPQAVQTTATFSESGTYQLVLTATDGLLTNSAEVSITVNAEGQPIQIEPSSNIFFPQKDAFIKILFSLDAARHVQGILYDRHGGKIATLIDGPRPAGVNQEITWDGRNSQGTSVVSGVYFFVLKAGDFTQKKKIVVVK